MNLFSKIAAAAVVATSVLSAAEVIDLSDKNFWRDNPKVSFAENQIIPNGHVMLLSKKTITIDPAKKYTLKMEVITGEGEKPNFFLSGLVPADKKGRALDALNLQTVNNSFTQITENAAKGDKIIKVKDASNWKNNPIWKIAYNAKEDFSDLPNRSILKSAIESITKDGDSWIITLKTPLSIDLPAGTNVRQHVSGGHYYFISSFIKPNKNQNFSKTITGKSNYGTYHSKGFHPAMTDAFLVIMADWHGKKTPIVIKNATLTIE